MTNNKTKGFLLGAIAAASYGMNPLFTLPLYSAGMSVDSVLFYRYALAIVVLGIMMKMQKQSFAIKKADVLPCLKQHGKNIIKEVHLFLVVPDGLVLQWII